MNDLFDQRLRDAARSAPTPGAPKDLIDRVLAARAVGERIILPTDSGIRRRSRARIAWGVLAAAAIIVVAILASPTMIDRPDPTAADSVSSTGLFVSSAYAEQTSSGPSAPPVRGMDGLKVVPRIYEYRTQTVDSAGHATVEGGGAVSVSDVGPVAGTPAWRIVLQTEQPEQGQRRTATETLFVAQRDLKPLTRVVHVRPYLRFTSLNISQRFTADSVLGEMTTDGGVHRPIARRLPAQYGPYISDAIAPLALAGVPLSASWSGSVSVIGWAVIPRDAFYPATLRVVGEERIVIGGRTFDCWKMYVVAGRQRRMQWVRKSDNLALRSDHEELTPKGHRRYELLNP